MLMQLNDLKCNDVENVMLYIVCHPFSLNFKPEETHGPTFFSPWIKILALIKFFTEKSICLHHMLEIAVHII